MQVAHPRVRALAAAVVAPLLLISTGCAAIIPSPASADSYTDCAYSGHRGYTRHAPENSMAAFRQAIADGANYIETDVQVTRDGAFVIMHDSTINRTTNGTGRIRDKTWAQLRTVRLSNGEPVPTLGELFALAKPTRTDVMVETKWIPPSHFAALKRLIDAFGVHRVIVNSFSRYDVHAFHARYPDVQTAVDTHRPISLASAKSFGGVMPDHHYASMAWLARLKSAGVPTYLWTVDSPAGWTRYRDKVTAVLTDKAAGYEAWRKTHCS